MFSKVELTEDSVNLIKEALEIYVRIGIGQFDRVVDVFDLNDRLTLEERKEVLNNLIAAKGHIKNQGHGIHHKDVDQKFKDANNLQHEFVVLSTQLKKKTLNKLT